MSGKFKTILFAAGFFLAGALTMAFQQRNLAQLRHDVAALQKAHASLAARALHAGPAGGNLTLNDFIKEGGRNQVDILSDALDYVAGLKTGEIVDALEALKKRPAIFATSTIRSLLLARWAEEKPADALAWVKAKDAPDTRVGDYRALFQAWSAKDLAGSMAGLKKIGDANLQINLQNGILGMLTLANPQSAMDLLHSLPQSTQSAYSLSYIYYFWGGLDPQAAAASALKLPATAARKYALQDLAYSWAQEDPQAAIAFAQSLPPSETRSYAAGWALDPLSQQDPKAAATFLATMPSGDIRNELIPELATNWAQQDPPAALAWAQSFATGKTYDDAVQNVLGEMGKTDPAGAAAFIAQMPDASTRDGAIDQLASTWAQSDLTGALAWAQSLPTSEGDARASALKDVMSAWGQNDPASAAEFLGQNFSNDPNFNAVAQQLAGQWVAADPSAALAWAETLPPGPAQADSLATVFSNLTKTDPQSAWAEVQQLPTGSREKAMGTVLSTWSAQNPAQAAAMLGTLPAGTALDDAASAVATNWVQQNPAAATQWVNTLQPGSARDSAVAQIISSQAKNDPSASFTWAASIGDVTMQQNQMNNVVQQWAKKDAAAATNAVQSAPLTDQQRTDLLKAIQKAQAVN